MLVTWIGLGHRLWTEKQPLRCHCAGIEESGRWEQWVEVAVHLDNDGIGVVSGVAPGGACTILPAQREADGRLALVPGAAPVAQVALV